MVTDTQSFIEKAKTVHGDKYDYSKVLYIKQKDKVIIVCPEHGDFEQTPGNHLNGQGCKVCGYNSLRLQYSSTLDEFIKRANKIHNNYYDYSNCIYINSKTNINILCPIHGEFNQKPNSHLNGSGCRKCGCLKRGLKERLKHRDSIVQRFKDVHGDKYNYSLVNYKNATSKVKIICPLHGEFKQAPANHLNGSGCRNCDTGGGFAKTYFINRCGKRGSLYIVECANDLEVFIKVGIAAKNVKTRTARFPYDTKTLHIFNGDPSEIWDLEKYLHRKLRNFKYIPNLKFGGYTECFTLDSYANLKNILFNF